MDQTKRILIHTANTLVPVSLILVGVGKGDMSDMNILDADNRSLSHRGVRAKRDIVQFVGESKLLLCILQIWKKHKSPLLPPQNTLLGFSFAFMTNIFRIQDLKLI